MIKIIIIVAALMAGLILGPEISANKGYILLSVDGYTTYEITILNAIIIAFILYFVLLLVEWIFRKLLSMNSITKNWFSLRKTKKAQKNSALGMVALFEGNDKQAYKLLEKSAPRSDTPSLTYIAAAKAAHNQGNYAQRDEHFQQAYGAQKNCKLAAGLAWAELQVEAKQFKKASITLSELERKNPKNKRISELFLSIYPALEQWEDYIALLKSKRNVFSFDDDKMAAMLLDGYQKVFRKKALESGEALEMFWDKEPSRGMRKELNYQKAFLDAHIDAGNDKLAETFLLDKLKKQFSIELLTYVDKLQITDYHSLTALLERKLVRDPENGSVNQVLAHLYVKNDQEESAIKCLQESLKTVPNVKDFALLAELLQKEGREDEANEYNRLGLLLAASE